ncbi:unnamed protein product [Closterium sp. Yama58-4]|nr:unnamed protein product [Closterium sp. Yama58-4]
MYDTSAVPIFTGQNYSAWKFKFQVLMMERGLWGLFDGTEKKPDDESDIAAWKKKDQKAFATLISRIGINLVSSVRTCIKLEASAHEAWKRLETIHVNKTLHGKILARNAFYMVKWRASESIHEYATRVEELGETFVDLGGTVTEEDWILTLLCGLPEEWSTVITTLDSVQDTWTKETVVGRLLHEESRRRQFANESVETAMFSGGSSGGKSKWSKGATKKSYGGSDRGKGNTSNGASKCHYCGKAGHFWRECRKRPSDWTPSKARNQEGNAHTASGEADDTRESIVLLAGDGTNTPNDAWFLDTGATQHMTHSASFLTNVVAPGDVTRVVFGNGKSLPVVGVGSTRLIVDGGPVDITNVLHVPGLKVNLLSVTQLAKKDVKVTIDGATMNLFWKGKQFAQGVLNGELYQLKTHPGAASSNVAQGSKATLKAWHNRLAHANYDSVKELVNKGLAKGRKRLYNKFKFQVLMMERGLWGLFDGTEKKPDDESDIAAWKKKDQKVFATLISRIGINLVSSVRTCIKLEASAHEAWKRLETIHVNKTLHCKILARNAFYTVKLRAGESMHEYATRVEELGETFVDLGGTVTEEDWILTLLCGLPEEWSTVITTLDSVQDTWTKETVVGRLLHEESRRRQFANESVETAMFSGGSSGGKSKWSKGATKKSYGGSDRGKGNTSNGASKCHYCGKAGHFWRECRKRPSDWTPSKARNQEGNAHTASGEADDSKESLVLVAGNGNETPSDAWFLDTGATQHMTHSASLLNNIGAPGDVTSIVFGNNESLPVVGVGSTRLIVDSGPVDVMNVLHVPGVKVNLLSVPKLAKKGVIATIDGAKMNLFWKGEQFAQGVLHGDIYQLKTYPRAASSNMASSNVAQCSKATLKAWHNRLAHANYDSVKELVNKGLAKGVDVIAGDDEKGVCTACVEGKMARKPFAAAMGRMHSHGKGISRSALPYKRTPPSWLKISATEVDEHICKLAKKGLTPSQIGVILRDSHGIAQVSGVTGSKVLRILKAHGLAPEIPEDLYHLIKKALAVRKHLERNRKDKDSKFRLILIESRVHRLARYYKWTKKLPPNWKYESGTASTLVA